ncbi:MAG: hypothetical protein H7Y38_00825, partial [Armatimonadetes bacterium]|nr:hypothetical protein [Armatimonadota bacterium]
MRIPQLPDRLNVMRSLNVSPGLTTAWLASAGLLGVTILAPLPVRADDPPAPVPSPSPSPAPPTPVPSPSPVPETPDTVPPADTAPAEKPATDAPQKDADDEKRNDRRDIRNNALSRYLPKFT